MDDLKLNVPLLKRRVPNLTSAARLVGLRPATVSNLTTGKIPVGRAEVKTLVALATLAECRLDELIIRGNASEMIETGIKVLDVFAPLVKGGTIGFVARKDMGQIVLLGEILSRLNNQGFATVLLLPDDKTPAIEDVSNQSEIVCHTIEESYEQIMKIGKKKDVAFAADRSRVLTGELYSLQDDLQEKDIKSLTTFLFDPLGEAVDEEEPYGPLDTLWSFDADLISRHIYPAINPIISTSTVLEGAHLDSNHMIIQRHARKLLRRYRELRFLVNARGMDQLPQSERKTFERGERLEYYLTQLFYIAEPYTKKPGVTVALQDVLTDIQKILNGGMDSIEPKSLYFISTLEDV